MRRLNLGGDRHRERGVTTIFIAMSMVMLLGAVGLGVDTGSLRYEKSKFQHAADASALGIGNDCAINKPECASYQLTANTLTTDNSSASNPGVSPSPVQQSSGIVTVTVDKMVPTYFFKAFGISSKEVKAVATVKWTKNPIKGPVLPFAVSMCDYAKTPVNTPTVIRADLNGEAKAEIVKTGNTTDTKAYAQLDPYLMKDSAGNTAPCNVPSDVTLPGSPSSVTMLQGGLWLSDAGNSISNGKLLSTQILQSLESVTGYFQGGHKYDAYLTPGMTLMMAVYAPTSNYQYAGLRVSGGKADHPASFDMRLVGYTPFVLSGWCFQQGKGNACATSGGAVPSRPGFAGKFVASSIQPPKLNPDDSDFEYGDAGSDFRAVKVELVE